MNRRLKFYFGRKKKEDMVITVLPGLDCNYRCKMCHMWKNKRNKIMSDKDWISLIKSLKNDDKNIIISIGGGEPFLHNSSFDIMKVCKNQGYRCHISTNGSLLTKRNVIKSIDLGIEVINISLDSLDEKTHDKFRGIPGAFNKVINAINFMEKNDKIGHETKGKAGLSINTLIMEPNLDHIIKIANWVLEKDYMTLNLQAITQPFQSIVNNNWFVSKEFTFLWPKNSKKVNDVVDELIYLKKNKFGNKMINTVTQLRLFKQYFKYPQNFIKHKGCSLVDKNSITINPDGTVYLCPYMGNIGNIMKNNFNTIIKSNSANDTIKSMCSCTKNCHHLMNAFYQEEYGISS